MERGAILVGEIEGWRAWTVDAEAPTVLHSLITSYTWTPGVNIARCQPPGAAEPRALCEGDEWVAHNCGFWALRGYHQLLAHAWVRQPQFSRHVLLGKVKLAGRFIEGTLGSRAAEAEIVALVEPDEWPMVIYRPPPLDLHATVAACAERYGVPVIPAPEPEEVDHGHREAGS